MFREILRTDAIYDSRTSKYFFLHTPSFTSVFHFEKKLQIIGLSLRVIFLQASAFRALCAKPVKHTDAIYECYMMR